MSHSCKGLCKSYRFKNWLDNQNITLKQNKVKKCSECQIRFKEFDEWYCPCCGNRIRTRNTYCREKVMMKKKLVEIRTNNVIINYNGIEIIQVVKY